MITSIRLFFIGISCLVYLIGTSVFSHMLVMQDHHPVEVSEHTHENLKEHDHIQIESCSSVECYIDCTSIEKIKVTNLSSWLNISSVKVSNHFPNTSWDFDYHVWEIVQLKTYHKLSVSGRSKYRSKFLEFADLVGIILITS